MRANDEQEWSQPPEAGDPAIVLSEAFMRGHPDLKWRAYGMRMLEQDKPALAYGYFRRASRYADKASQAMVAEMLWNGQGVAQDRPMAYVWMDLAAERGQPKFLGHRERYWEALSADEQERALAQGGAVYDEYGDDVAKERHARVMRRTRRETTGSRLGATGNLQVIPYVNGQPQQAIDGGLFFAPKYWDEERYWDWQDELWDQLPKGVVEVLPIRPDEGPVDGDP